MDLDDRGNPSHLGHFNLECNMDCSSDDDQYLVLTKDEEEEEGDDGVISYWSEDDGDWFFDQAGRDFPNEGEVQYEITEVMHIWGPLKDEDWSIKLKTLFEEEDEKKSDKPKRREKTEFILPIVGS